MGFLNDVFYLLLVISILVVIHEFGHFIAARLTGMRAEVFSVGMGPRILGWNKITGFNFGKLAKDWDGQGHTDYRIALLPIGGYVKISGMIDESMDTEFIKKEPQAWEFRSKSTLQKTFVISAGVIMNTLLAILFFSAIAFFSGKSLYQTTTIRYVESKSIAETIGFKAGDKILSVNGKAIVDWEQFFQLLAEKDFGNNKYIKVQREGNQVTLKAEGTKILKTISNQEHFGIYPKGTKVLIMAIETLKPAGKAGMQPGDTVKSINGEQICSITQFIGIVKSHKNSSLFIEWERKGKILSDSIKPTEKGIIGVQIDQDYFGPVKHVDYGLLESINIGADETYRTVVLFVGSVVQIIKGNVSVKQSIGGPIMIAKSASQSAERGLSYFIRFMAVLSITLAVLNILPFPALDGGHLVFIIIEGIIRREVPPKVKIVFQQIGFAVLMLFMLYVIYNDFTRL
ncbi:MAG: RIP metalloprotease RseP [Ignavibacteria bacterium GWB2_35_12]|nr:MAG: RIP metalloprotease RseP [Ignavibacteria bacterium GWA2_35_8]OGU39804.1 MAG: RIP metalloprotease RseP [Ignavibacteria bacterium GWB2_35_12]OGU95148.1 MAG: RIP metalloprotease RseP [Ignavibacteria bacterium RIFOXYA2_FULL_35_10]OGV21434.1 MAG: RIP metalloprotease RseP [Ignavibacteria bacterium RIFOXYC2_FULL_35_21]